MLRATAHARPSRKLLLCILSSRYLASASTSGHAQGSTSTGCRSQNAGSSVPHQLTAAQSERVDSMLRVDQAGELAADWIYRGQMAVLGTDIQIGPVIQNMWDQEKRHLEIMNQLQVQYRVRPTALWEVAKVAGFGLGAMTALMGREAAMACTEAVETVIGEHYNDQLEEMKSYSTSDPNIESLKAIITGLRDDELEHLDTAVEHHSQRAPAHALLSTVIGEGCKIAIELCKRI